MASNAFREKQLARCRKSKVYAPMNDQTLWPIVFHPKYDIKFFGIEKCHPFDAGKWGRVFNELVSRGVIKRDRCMQPVEVTYNDLLLVHTRCYLHSLNWSAVIARIMEVPIVIFFPACLIHYKVLSRFRLQTGGTVLAARVALELGTCVNIGGGFHHCSGSSGGGFCPYADITLALRFLFVLGFISKAMIIDLDAHQGNGHERDFMGDKRVYIVDMYNSGIYPFDLKAKKAINKDIRLPFMIKDDEYQSVLRKTLQEAYTEFKPDLVVYNAGTDCLEGDELGGLALSPQGIVERDELVFRMFRKYAKPPVPVVMVTSGGYQYTNAMVIADSLTNLIKKGYVQVD